MDSRTTSVSVLYNDGLTDERKSSVMFNRQLSMKGNEFNPHDYGNEQNPLHYWGAFFHILKYIIGTGILALPFAFKNVGYLVGIIGMVIVGVLYLHILHVLINVEYELSKRCGVPHLTYVEVVSKSFMNGPTSARRIEPYFRSLIYFNYTINGCLGNGSYLLIMGTNLEHVYGYYTKTECNVIWSLTFLIIPLIVLCWIPRLKFLIPFSMFTNVFTLVNIAIIALSSFDDNSANKKIVMVGDLTYFPQFFGMALVALTATGLVLPVKNDMEKPKKFSAWYGVLNSCVALVTVLYAAFGTTAYMKFGEATEGNVLANLPPSQILSVLVFLFYTGSLCVSFTISFYIIFDTIWSNYLEAKLKNNKRSIFVVYTLKLAINVITYLIAIGIPNFELFSSLSGSFCILTDICLPPFLQILVDVPQNSNKLVRRVMVKNGLIVLVGMVLFIWSFVGSVIDIVNFYRN